MPVGRKMSVACAAGAVGNYDQGALTLSDNVDTIFASFAQTLLCMCDAMVSTEGSALDGSHPGLAIGAVSQMHTRGRTRLFGESRVRGG